jgi:hypothetical protein
LPDKPTHPFGYATFSPDGKVKMHRGKLPDEKAGQERVIAEAFASRLGVTLMPPLHERDHDFEMVRASEIPERVVVQATEVTYWDFLRPMTQEEYDRGSVRQVVAVPIDDPFAVAQIALAARAGRVLAAPNLHAVARVAGQLVKGDPTARPFAVEQAKLDRSLLAKIEDKKAHYPKPNDHSRLWLLIWTVCDSFPTFWNEACVSPGVNLARAELAKTGSGPFDEVWFMQYVGFGMYPNRIWPPE